MVCILVVSIRFLICAISDFEAGLGFGDPFVIRTSSLPSQQS